MNDRPLVSIIIPLYNAAKYVGDAIKSITSQTYKALEIVVVNDGSTDNGPSIVEKMAETDSRIKLLHQENKGQCAASNAGYKISTGTYVKFFDADDILSPETIYQQVEVLQNSDEFSVSYIDYIRFYDDDLSTIDRYKLPKLINYDCTPAEYITFHGSPQMYQCSIWLFHRAIFDKSGLWDERLSLINDTEFFPRILKYVSRLYYAANCKLYYRTNFRSGSLSQTVTEKSMRSAILSVDLMAKHTRSFISSELMERIIALSYVEILEMSYPSQPKWTKIIEGRLKQFNKSQYTLTSSGKLYNLVSKIAGWKTAKKIQHIYYLKRYKNRKAGTKN
ncbi:MAG: glycosyltransferase family 2 protein [Flavobacterium sp.]|nr:MAG: glycosyltransferase family 2 protein [Flavobacterium sp.]